MVVLAVGKGSEMLVLLALCLSLFCRRIIEFDCSSNSARDLQGNSFTKSGVTTPGGGYCLFSYGLVKYSTTNKLDKLDLILAYNSFCVRMVYRYGNSWGTFTSKGYSGVFGGGYRYSYGVSTSTWGCSCCGTTTYSYSNPNLQAGQDMYVEYCSFTKAAFTTLTINGRTMDDDVLTRTSGIYDAECPAFSSSHYDSYWRDLYSFEDFTLSNSGQTAAQAKFYVKSWNLDVLPSHLSPYSAPYWATIYDSSKKRFTYTKESIFSTIECPSDQSSLSDISTSASGISHWNDLCLFSGSSSHLSYNAETLYGTVQSKDFCARLSIYIKSFDSTNCIPLLSSEDGESYIQICKEKILARVSKDENEIDIKINIHSGRKYEFDLCFLYISSKWNFVLFINGRKVKESKLTKISSSSVPMLEGEGEKRIVYIGHNPKKSSLGSFSGGVLKKFEWVYASRVGNGVKGPLEVRLSPSYGQDSPFLIVDYDWNFASVRLGIDLKGMESGWNKKWGPKEEDGLLKFPGSGDSYNSYCSSGGGYCYMEHFHQPNELGVEKRLGFGLMKNLAENDFCVRMNFVPVSWNSEKGNDAGFCFEVLRAGDKLKEGLKSHFLLIVCRESVRIQLCEREECPHVKWTLKNDIVIGRPYYIEYCLYDGSGETLAKVWLDGELLFGGDEVQISKLEKVRSFNPYGDPNYEEHMYMGCVLPQAYCGLSPEIRNYKIELNTKESKWWGVQMSGGRGSSSSAGSSSGLSAGAVVGIVFASILGGFFLCIFFVLIIVLICLLVVSAVVGIGVQIFQLGNEENDKKKENISNERVVEMGTISSGSNHNSSKMKKPELQQSLLRGNNKMNTAKRSNQLQNASMTPIQNASMTPQYFSSQPQMMRNSTPISTTGSFGRVAPQPLNRPSSYNVTPSISRFRARARARARARGRGRGTSSSRFRGRGAAPAPPRPTSRGRGSFGTRGRVRRRSRGIRGRGRVRISRGMMRGRGRGRMRVRSQGMMRGTGFRPQRVR